jgi:hypothetical protein
MLESIVQLVENAAASTTTAMLLQGCVLGAVTTKVMQKQSSAANALKTRGPLRRKEQID